MDRLKRGVLAVHRAMGDGRPVLVIAGAALVTAVQCLAARDVIGFLAGLVIGVCAVVSGWRSVEVRS